MEPIVIESKDCGSFACFYKQDEVNETTLKFNNIKSITAYTDQGDVLLKSANFNKTFVGAIKAAAGVGVRVEGIAAAAPATTMPEAVQAFINVKNVYGNGLASFTTYAPCVLEANNVYVIYITFKTPIQFNYNRKGLEQQNTILASGAVLSMHQSCAINLADMQQLTWDTFSMYMKNIKNSLDIMHENGKFHGDIKLRNMVQCEGTAKLIDFPGKTEAKNMTYRITESGIQPNNFTKTYNFKSRNGNVAMEGALYDRICFNLIVANFVVVNKLGTDEYAELAYKDATQFINTYENVHTDYSFGDVVEKGLEFIRMNKFMLAGATPRRTASRIHIANRERVIYKGARGVQYVRIKGTFVSVRSLRAQARVGKKGL
jgi:hypothetical protein